MIILDTHIWVWWVHGDAHLPERYNMYMALHEAQGLGEGDSPTIYVSPTLSWVPFLLL